MIKNIPAKQIHWENRIRKDEGDIESFAAVIAITERFTPILVRKIKEGNYKGQDGKRRYLAVTLHLGWKEIPCDIEERKN